MKGKPGGERILRGRGILARLLAPRPTRLPLTALCAAIAVCISAAFTLGAAAQSSDADYFSDLRWRLVGPHRAGRIWCVAGVPGDPSVYYAGTPAGGLWKSTSGGTTWASVSDDLPVTGIGAVAVAPSDPDVVYVGTGSNTLGNGVYRSDDAGATWRHAGLADTKYITGLLIDPRDPDVVIAGVGSGGNFGSMVFYNNNPSSARGVYRSTDGGRSWEHTLFADASSSVVDLVSDPAAPEVVFASLSAPADAAPAGPPVYRSNDGGITWQRLAAAGLPAGAGSATIAVANGTSGRRLYALAGGRGSGGLFRSDDGGASFALMTPRLASARGHLYVHPTNPDVIYTMGTSVYRSTDGGRTLDAIKGAPGGDDPTALWIDPTNPRRMFLGADQGPAVTLDGGSTWTPWYTMPNGELYFVTTDEEFPYRIYAPQQDSGTVSILSRSDFGAIRPNDWYPVSGYEQGHIFSDPLDPRYVYSHGGGHVIVRFDRVTGQSGPVYTPSAEDRFGPRPGMDLSRKDPRWMFVGAQYVLASNDRVTWKQISPDLTARPDQPGGRAEGTIVALVASPLDVDLLWAGTSNGLIHVTRDAGATWTNVSPPRLAAESTLTLWSMEASSHDAGTAYAAAIDLSDRHGPALFMTSDFGATWREIVRGLPVDVPSRVVREDPIRPDLLYAGTQHGVFVSFDRGGLWQPLQLNLPRVPVLDITVHDKDLIIATWGRALWALDDVSPLRQIDDVRADTAPAFLFAPAPAVRVRWDNNQDTPLPPEVPQGQNPPDGASIDYYLRSAATEPVAISILDAEGALVREYTSVQPAPDTRMPNVPEYWFRTPVTTATTAGMHRLVWDLRYPTPPSLDVGAGGAEADTVSFGIIAAAIIGESPKQQPVGSLVLPGTYEVRLTAGGQTLTRRLTVTNDPRSEATAADLELQLGYERGLAVAIDASRAAMDAVRSLRTSARAVANGEPAVDEAVAAFDRAGVAAIIALAGNRDLAGRLADLQFADLKPTESTIAAVSAACARADDALNPYRELLQRDLAALNTALERAGVSPIPAVAGGARLSVPGTIACSPTALTLDNAQGLLDGEFRGAGVTATRVHTRAGGERALARIEVAGGPAVAAGWAEFARLAKGGWILIDVEYGPPKGLPRLLSVEQRQTRTDIQRIGAANAAMNRDLERFAVTIAELSELGYLVLPATHDAWGNPFVYVAGRGTYTVMSLGCDGASGPAAPALWVNEPCEPDIMMVVGVFIQMPAGQ